MVEKLKKDNPWFYEQIITGIEPFLEVFLASNDYEYGYFNESEDDFGVGIYHKETELGGLINIYYGQDIELIIDNIRAAFFQIQMEIMEELDEYEDDDEEFLSPDEYTIVYYKDLEKEKK